MKKYVRTILDYPVKGIKFRDITTLLKDPKMYSEVIDQMTEPWKDENIDAMVIELGTVSAGFSKRQEIRDALMRFKESGKNPQ